MRLLTLRMSDLVLPRQTCLTFFSRHVWRAEERDTFWATSSQQRADVHHHWAAVPRARVSQPISVETVWGDTVGSVGRHGVPSGDVSAVSSATARSFFPPFRRECFLQFRLPVPYRKGLSATFLLPVTRTTTKTSVYRVHYIGSSQEEISCPQPRLLSPLVRGSVALPFSFFSDSRHVFDFDSCVCLNVPLSLPVPRGFREFSSHQACPCVNSFLPDTSMPVPLVLI